MKLYTNCLPIVLALAACGQGGGSERVNVTPARATASPANAAANDTLSGNAVAVSSSIESASALTDAAMIKSHVTIVDELRRVLVGKAMFDGKPITDVQTLDACRTAVSTAQGRTTVEWARAGNIAPRDLAGREINDLPTARGPKALSVPSGAATAGVSGAVGMLVSDCVKRSVADGEAI